METFYRKALEDLNTRHDGAYIFEAFCHVIVKALLPDYHFTMPAGGKGTSDGGRDGFAADKKARMACSIQKDYDSKIKDELKKVNNEDELFYFSNQIISEPDKRKYEKNTNTKFTIFSLENLIEKIKDTSEEDQAKIDSLLRLSIIVFEFTKEKLSLRKRNKNTSTTEIYTSQLVIENGECILKTKNPIADYLISECKTKNFSDLPNFFVKGQCGIGKTFLMNETHDKILELQDTDLNFKLLPLFFDLKNFPDVNFEIPDKKNLFFIFLDGLDEISETNKIALAHKLQVTADTYKNIRFIIAGRDGGFSSEITTALKNTKTLLLIPYNDTSDIKLSNLLKTYDDSSLSDLLFIPLFRTYFIQNQNKKINSFEEFYKLFIVNQLEKDKSTFDEAEKISKRANAKSKINIDNIVKKMQMLCCKLFNESEYRFSEEDLKKCFTEDEYLYLVQSSLLYYQDENQISFVSAFYFEYFTASFFKNRTYTDIKKALFIKNGKEINVQHLSILMILLNILDKASKTYKRLIADLEKISPCYILLTDFGSLPAEKRYEHYESILNYYNTNKKHIYYGRFTSSADLVANISSLAYKMQELLQGSYYENACALHTERITAFLNKPNENELMAFANSIILLGIYSTKIWSISQQKKIREQTIPLFQFFLNDPLAEKLSGLLSVNIILHWYALYEWTQKWGKEDWNNFLQKIDTHFNTLEAPISDKKEFSFKLKIYNTFYHSADFDTLLYQIIIYLLQLNNKEKTIYSHDAFLVPHELDDTYKTPTVTFDNDLFYLKNNLENVSFDKKSIIKIFSFMADNNIASSIGIHQEYKDIIDNLYLKFSEITKTLDINDVDTVYKILCYFLQNSIYRTATISVINNISDDLKIKCFEYFYKNIQEQNINYIFAMPVLFTMLLNIKEEKMAIWSLEELNSSELIGVYKDIVCFILNKEQNHILKSYTKKVYDDSYLFEHERNIKAAKQEKQKELNADIQAMESREEEILLNKNALLTEISKVFQFIDRNKDFYPDETERGKLLYLRIQEIQDEINFDYKNSYQVPPVFSSSVINFLFDISDNNKNINRLNLTDNINNWFQSDKFYWRFIFQFFVYHSEDDKAINFIRTHKRIYEKIEKSMEQEMNEFMKTCTVSNFDIQGVQHPIITPFIYYVQNMYDNKCPAWFDKTNILNFCFISCWYFSISPGSRITADFSCGEFSSVYDWLSKVFDCSTDDMLEYCITNIHHIQNEDLYAQCMDFILKNIDNDKFKNKIEDLLFLSTKKEIQAYKNTKKSSKVNSVISLFWTRCTNNEYIDKILEMEIPDTEQINIKDNYCQIEIENYIIKYATLTQKKYIIKILKKKISNNNVLIFLSRLGYKKAVHLEINNYCNGKTLDQEILFGVSSPFGYMKKSTGLLIDFMSLFMYSIADDTDRRQALQHIACNGIQSHITKRNFFIFKIKFNALIKKLRQENKYYDSVENFKNEITQYTFLQ